MFFKFLTDVRVFLRPDCLQTKKYCQIDFVKKVMEYCKIDFLQTRFFPQS